jgi:hypothetical protein
MDTEEDEEREEEDAELKKIKEDIIRECVAKKAMADEDMKRKLAAVTSSVEQPPPMTSTHQPADSLPGLWHMYQRDVLSRDVQQDPDPSNCDYCLHAATCPLEGHHKQCPYQGHPYNPDSPPGLWHMYQSDVLSRQTEIEDHSAEPASSGRPHSHSTPLIEGEGSFSISGPHSEPDQASDILGDHVFRLCDYNLLSLQPFHDIHSPTASMTSTLPLEEGEEWREECALPHPPQAEPTSALSGHRGEGHFHAPCKPLSPLMTSSPPSTPPRTPPPPPQAGPASAPLVTVHPQHGEGPRRPSPFGICRMPKALKTIGKSQKVMDAHRPHVESKQDLSLTQ